MSDIVECLGEILPEKNCLQYPVTITLYIIGNLKKGRGRAVTRAKIRLLIILTSSSENFTTNKNNKKKIELHKKV
jgi:hypothetical protein